MRTEIRSITDQARPATKIFWMFEKNSEVLKMDFQAFEKWIENLNESDRIFLQRHKEWKKEYKKIQEAGVLSKGFVEKTMEVLEDGSESET